MGYSPWGHKELDTAEAARHLRVRLCVCVCIHTHIYLFFSTT